MDILGSYTELNKSGVYCIKNVINNKIYIGSSNSIYYRLKRHSSDLNKNRHANQHLQNSYNKYGKQNFIGFVIKFCKNLEKEEQFFLKNLKPAYNKREASRNSPISKETREKISQTLKKKYASGEIKTYRQNHAWIPIDKFDLHGNYICSYECIMDAVRDNKGLFRQNITSCLKGEVKRVGKFNFKYKNDK